MAFNYGRHDYSEEGDICAHAGIIYTIVRQAKPKRILEIGIAQGVSTTTIAAALSDGAIVCEYHGCDIDPNCRSLEVGLKALTSQVFLHIVSSDELAKCWTLPLDILFIDGGHEYSQVKRDLFNFLPFLNKNGIIFLHDTYPPTDYDKLPHRCWDAYHILDDLHRLATIQKIEFVTLPYSFGLTICRRLC